MCLLAGERILDLVYQALFLLLLILVLLVLPPVCVDHPEDVLGIHYQVLFSIEVKLRASELTYDHHISDFYLYTLLELADLHDLRRLRFFSGVSGRTIPEAVCSSRATLLTNARSPSGLNFIYLAPLLIRQPPLKYRPGVALSTVPSRGLTRTSITWEGRDTNSSTIYSKSKGGSFVSMVTVVTASKNTLSVGALYTHSGFHMVHANCWRGTP